MYKKRLNASSALTSAAFLGAALIASPVFAQVAPPPPTVQSDAPIVTLPVDEPTAKKDSTDIVVTGSRLKRSVFNSPDPIVVIDPELGKAAGQFSTAELLQSSPVASGSNQITTSISANFVTNGGPGSETISLRGLGANRTLVLLNGRRAGPAGTRGGVSSFDLNVLPGSIIGSIEILKTGASSVYGSDAVAGVVNLMTKKSTKGLELSGFSSIPTRSGGERYRLSAAWGKEFDRGHFLIAGDYSEQKELKRRDRNYLDCAEEYIFRPTGERADIIDPRTGSPRCSDFAWGHVWVYDADFNQAGRWQPDFGQNLGQYIGQNNPPEFVTPPDFYHVGYDRASASVDNLYHPFIAASTVTPPSRLYTLYADASYNVTDDVEVGTELLFNRRVTSQTSAAQFYYLTGYTNKNSGAAGPGTDPFSPGWEGPYYLSPTPITDHVGSAQQVNYYRAVGWAKGTFGDFLGNWSWDAWGQYSRSDGRYQNDVVFKDSIDMFNYRTSSCVGQLSPISKRPCLDIDWTQPNFLAGKLTPAERNFLYGEDFGRTVYEQTSFEVSANGTLFKLPAGPVQAALGVDWRRDSINDVPGINARLDNNFVTSSSGITAGYTITKEAFGEIEIPLIHNTPLIDQLTISASGRVTSVTQKRPADGAHAELNGNWTYSVGANWQVTDWLRFRGRYGTSFRSPALFELFLANQTSGGNNRQIDPCLSLATNLANGTITQQLYNNCRAGTATIPGVPLTQNSGGIQAIVTQGGGIGVVAPETSNAKSASIILTPKFDFLPQTNISIAVDYFDITINGEIATLSAAQVVSGCYNSQFFPSEPLCNLFHRFPAGAASQFNISDVRASFINVNEQKNSGIDVTINVNQGLGKLGKLSFLGQMTWQFVDKVSLFAGNVRDDNGKAGQPRWTGDFKFTWAPTPRTSVFYGLNVVGRTNNDADYQRAFGLASNTLCQTTDIYGTYCANLTAKPTFYHSMSISQKIDDDKFDITLGVTNLFNTRPPRVTIQGSNSLNGNAIQTVGQSVFTSQYDLLGRRIFVAVTAKM